MKELTHTDRTGKASMVDVGSKEILLRIARASGHIRLDQETISLIKSDQIRKGDVLTTARIAGITAAKQTSAIIPLTHNIVLDYVNVDAEVDDTGVKIVSEVRCTGKTGVEMEALTAVSAALLTVYDMCKAVDRNMVIDNLSLIEKIKQ
jgi:cyclic pyranopterin monophosphate synthase